VGGERCKGDSGARLVLHEPMGQVPGMWVCQAVMIEEIQLPETRQAVSFQWGHAMLVHIEAMQTTFLHVAYAS
jgi:hypothetical protein